MTFSSDVSLQIEVDAIPWHLELAGKVAIALDPSMLASWQAGGCHRIRPRAQSERVFALHIPRQGHRVGLALVVAYAPVSSAPAAERNAFLTQLSEVRSKIPAGDLTIIGGDFNAEIHQALHGQHPSTLAPWGSARTSPSGHRLLEWCTREHMTLVDTKFSQPHAKRCTWWHPARSTGHILDHVLTPAHQLRYFDNVKTVHEGRRGNAGTPLRRVDPQHVAPADRLYWDDFTDHLPVEIKFHYWARFAPRPTDPVTAPRPQVNRLALPGEQSHFLQQHWHRQLDQALQAAGAHQQQLSWDTLSSLCLHTSTAVLGLQHKISKRPHLVGHEIENAQLDIAVHDAHAYLRTFDHDMLPRDAARQRMYDDAKHAYRQAGHHRRQTRLRWKWTWLDSLTDELITAQQQGDSRSVFAIHNILGLRDHYLKRSPHTHTVPNPEAEREAWKLHFQQLQAGREHAAAHVWNNVSRGNPAGPALSTPPSDEELAACAKHMKNGKAAGSDGFLAEFYKYGSPTLRNQINNLVRHTWQAATEAPPGQEATNWPTAWNTGTVIPLWKKKGSPRDKNTYRGITLLSVGSKLLARVVAQRLQTWTETWLHETQMGFRCGRPVDDALQVTRRIVEEAAASHDTQDVVSIRLFDIEKAYPRVSRDTLWTLLAHKGAPAEFMNVCKALREHTQYVVRIHKGFSTPYSVDKGLREGCPSSPPLFNLYHHAVMEDFRVRRAQQANQSGYSPGIPWTTKIDGRVHHGYHSRQHLHKKAEQTVLGDIGFADDTSLVGLAAEMSQAEILLETTMRDWQEKVRPEETEGLRLQTFPRAPTDVRHKGEQATIRHVGGFLQESGSTHTDTMTRKSRAYHKIYQTAKAWHFGARATRRNLPHSLRIRIMKAVV